MRLLGDPALVSPDGVEHLLERRAAALLALAAIEPGVARRRAAALLWPDSDESNARQALRQQLLRLRKLGGGELLVGDGSLRLAGHVASDLATGHARAALLGSFDYGDAEELAQWVRRQRARLHRDGAERLAQALSTTEASGDLDDALALAEQLLESDPDSEQNHRNVMRLHYLRGDVAKAQAAYERLCALLEREFEARPSAETESLARTIRTAGQARPLAVSAAPPPSVLRPPRLIGREREWRALELCWKAPVAAVVMGVGGMGKTRLVGDFASAQGGMVRVAARPGDTFAAFSLSARMARALVGRVDGALSEGLRSELARLLPELGKSPPIRDDADRRRLGRAIEALLEAAAGSGVAGIAIDDLHYADAASIEAMHGSVAAGRLRWILACRGDEAGAELRALLDALVSSGAGNLVELPALTETQVGELLDSLDIESVSGAELARDIARHTGGNPLFVLETVKAMLMEAGASDRRLPAAANVTALIARRLGKLSAGAVAIARCAAVAGQDFSPELAAHVIGVRPLVLADAWAELEQAHVLRDGAFEHDLVYEAALASVPAAIARRLHAEIAAFLEGCETEPARVAAHWVAARRPKEASGAFMRASARARDAGRRIEEADLLGQAAECFSKFDAHDQCFEALHARAEAMSCNDLGDATLDAVDAVDEAARNNDQKLRALLLKAQLLDHRSDSEAAVLKGRAGLALAKKAKRNDLAVRFSVVVADGLAELRRVDEALEVLEPFREMAERLDPRTRVDYLVSLGIALDLANRLSQALESFEAARAIAAEHGLKDLLATCLSNLATTSSKRGELTRAVDLGRKAILLWRESEDLKGKPTQTQTLLAHRLRDIGHYSEAVPLLEDALEEFRRAGTRHWVFASAHRLALAYAHLGEHARALKLMQEDPAGLQTKMQAMWMAHRAEIARLCDGAAIKPVRSALALLGNDLDDGNNRLVSLFAAAIVPPEEGEAMATAAAAWAAARERFGMAVAAHVRAAGCALALKAIDRAVPQIQAALRLFADYEPDNFYRAELWWVAFEVFGAANRADDARAMLAAGRQWIERTAAEHVPAEFRASFLERNPVNAALLRVAAA